MRQILLIEDNKQSARIVSKVLGKQGFTVHVAETGEDGLISAMEASPDLILIDLGLPDIDGQTVISIMRQQNSLDNVPLVAFTAWPQDTARDMAMAYGCDGVISKPVDTATLIRKIKEYLKVERSS
jgi:two-component system cell cycle response regulator DivK